MARYGNNPANNSIFIMAAISAKLRTGRPIVSDMDKMREKHLEDFARMSRFAGGRPDLIQAGGGNASVKMDGNLMLIKASGCHMLEAAIDSGYAQVRYDVLRKCVSSEAEKPERPPKKESERAAAKAFASATVGGARPSIEMFMHAILGKCVLHTHPVYVAAVTCREGWREIISAKFPDALLVEYHTPGLELAVAIYREIIERGKNPQQDGLVVFLKNHGLVVSSEDSAGAVGATDAVCAALSEVSGIDADGFRTASEISERVGAGSTGLSCFEASDALLLRITGSHPELLFAPPFCPDSVVYNGPASMRLDSFDDPAPLKAYLDKHGEIPRVIFHGGRIFFIAANSRDARNMEEVLKFHVLVLSANNGNACSLPEDEIRYLRGWEAEKFRNKL